MKQSTIQLLGKTAHFANWHSFNNQLYARPMRNIEQCISYCQQTSACFGFVYSPFESMCWLKTGNAASYVKSSWAADDLHSRGDQGGLYMLNRDCKSFEGTGSEFCHVLMANP